jgi:predicted AlkP superfamily phosphohydrolase/phosphomutase
MKKIEPIEKTKSKHVLLIGLDGGTFDLIDPWLLEGHLPNIQSLLNRGARATLRSVILPFTPQAWGSFMTGMNPGNHGIFGFKEKEEGRYAFQFVNNRSIKSKTLWRYLSDYGKKSILVNIPMTYPPEKIDGVVIGGMDAPGVDSEFTFPPEMKDEIFRVVKDYVIHLHVGAGYLDSDKKRKKAALELIRMAACREKLVLHLMKQHSWDFFGVNFSSIDQVQHHFWKYLDSDNPFKDSILNVYKRVDQAVGRICRSVPQGTNIFLMSDHGAGAASPYVFFIDEWLRQNKLLEFKKSFSVKGFATKCLKTALTTASQNLSSNVKDVLMRCFPGMRVKSQGYVRRALINWRQTKVFSGEHPSTLRINLKGREEQGIVEPHEYDDLRERLIDELEGLKNPFNGQKLIEKVYRREALYHGHYVSNAPDLIIHPVGFAYQIKGGRFTSRYYKQVISKKNPNEFFVNGVHRLNGIFIAAGDGIKTREATSQLDIFDLFPTVLYALGLSVPANVDGKVAGEVFEEGYLAANPIGYSKETFNEAALVSSSKKNYKEEDMEKIAESLRGLGYID